RTQDAGHALLRQGRNPKVRKNSGVIVPSAQHNKNAEAKTQKSGGVVPPDFLASQHTNLTRPA
ncbi:hypothetical protein, partial [Bifidobacterium adolescentis]|uniref:hypothetical protein n=1 Tax=Bifidobacterium adolescentis TaxID=1680 RepID=UPI0034A16C5A